jgi:hypothetical protein
MKRNFTALAGVTLFVAVGFAVNTLSIMLDKTPTEGDLELYMATQIVVGTVSAGFSAVLGVLAAFFSFTALSVPLSRD